MNSSKFGGLVLMLLFVSHDCLVSPQQDSSTTFRLSDLQSDDMEKRMDAFERIKDNSRAMQRPEVKSALLNLLDRENRLIHLSHNGPSMGEQYGEGYGVYASELAETVARIADWHDPHQVCVLAQSSPYSPSTIPDRLAVEAGAVAAPCLLKLAHGDYFDRSKSIPVLVQLSAVTKNLDPSLRREIRESALSGLNDSDAAMRMETTQALGRFGEPDMIPILTSIARSDPYSHVVDGKPFFDVRELALKAIRSIQERAKAH